MSRKTNNKIGNLFNPQVNTKIVLEPFRVPPLPEKALKIVPELSEWYHELQAAIDEIRLKDAVAIRGGAS